MTKYVELKTAIDAVNDVYYDTPDINLSVDKLEAVCWVSPLPTLHRWCMGGGMIPGDIRFRVVTRLSGVPTAAVH